MDKKKIVKFGLLWMPFVVGTLLFTFGEINLISSLLLFCGGYVGLKSMFNRKNINQYINKDNSSKVDNRVLNSDCGVNPSVIYKRVKRNTRVRKRVK